MNIKNLFGKKINQSELSLHQRLSLLDKSRSDTYVAFRDKDRAIKCTIYGHQLACRFVLQGYEVIPIEFVPRKEHNNA